MIGLQILATDAAVKVATLPVPNAVRQHPGVCADLTLHQRPPCKLRECPIW